ncbi:MAG: M50 family metallopeptidase [Elusimicrobiales bacterium]|nr:M50 family metallopeptidase [Elusimicrobiales bacterium]
MKKRKSNSKIIWLIKKALKPALWTLSIPFILALMMETGKCGANIFLNIKITLPFTIGFIIYIPFHFYSKHSSYLYVLAHELTHAVAAILNGIKIKKISVGKNNGYVTLSRDNIFISLAPYFIPFYAIILGAIYFVAGEFADLSRYRMIFVALIGFFTSFHIVNAIEITFFGPLQSDLKKAGGRFFSFFIIIFLNCLALLLIFKALYPDLVPLKETFQGILLNSKKIIEFIISGLNYLRLWLLNLWTNR